MIDDEGDLLTDDVFELDDHPYSSPIDDSDRDEDLEELDFTEFDFGLDFDFDNETLVCSEATEELNHA